MSDAEGASFWANRMRAEPSDSSAVAHGRQVEVFARFHGEIGDRAARYAATILGPRRLDVLEDVIQEAWAHAWRAWNHADAERRTAWFLRIVRNCAIDQHRRHRATESLSAAGDVDLRIGISGVEEATIARVDAKRTFAVLGGLSSPLREALWLREVLELSYAEIA